MQVSSVSFNQPNYKSNVSKNNQVVFASRSKVVQGAKKQVNKVGIKGVFKAIGRFFKSIFNFFKNLFGKKKPAEAMSDKKAKQILNQMDAETVNKVEVNSFQDVASVEQSIIDVFHGAL